MRRKTLYKWMLTVTPGLFIINAIVFGLLHNSTFHRFDRHESSRHKVHYNEKLHGDRPKPVEGDVIYFQGDLKKNNFTLSNNNTQNQRGGNSSWKESETKSISDVIQRRLHFLQNPPVCSKAKKIVCNFRVGCGFGCQVHHLSFCLIVAYGSGRTLILESKGWDYVTEGWEKLFLPLSENCRDGGGESIASWKTPDKNENYQVLRLPVVGQLLEIEKPDFLPMAMPEDMAEKVKRVHNNPVIWWIGEVVTYLLRLQPHVQELIDKKITTLGFEHPIVGIHIRRTDKLFSEAQYHDISEYMVHAEEFYNKMEKSQGESRGKRRIFLATDEAGLLGEAHKRYPSYVFVSDEKASQSAEPSSRFSEESLKGTIVDVHLLARSDFLVCTFSSNVGRLAYELMQHYHRDASTKVRSLDDEYYWHGANANSSGKLATMPVYEGAEKIKL